MGSGEVLLNIQQNGESAVEAPRRVMLRKTLIGLTEAALCEADTNDDHTKELLVRRVIYVLQKIPSMPGRPRYTTVLLGEVAKDVSVQRLLRGRLLSRVLADDKRFEFGEDPKRGKTIALAKMV